MRPEVRNFIIGVILTGVVLYFHQPILAFLEDALAEVKSWTTSVETKPRQSTRIHELEQTLDAGVEQASDEE